jgi:hypothetical protein
MPYETQQFRFIDRSRSFAGIVNRPQRVIRQPQIQVASVRLTNQHISIKRQMLSMGILQLLGFPESESPDQTAHMLPVHVQAPLQKSHTDATSEQIQNEQHVLAECNILGKSQIPDA